MRSPAPQIPPTILKNKQDIVVMYVYELHQQHALVIWLSRFVYSENGAIFAFRGNSYFRLVIDGTKLLILNKIDSNCSRQ